MFTANEDKILFNSKFVLPIHYIEYFHRRYKSKAWLKYDPSTLWLDVKDDLDITTIPQTVKDKVNALRILLTTDFFWHEPICFEKVVLAFNDRLMDYKNVQVADPQELAYALKAVKEVLFYDDRSEAKPLYDKSQIKEFMKSARKEFSGYDETLSTDVDDTVPILDDDRNPIGYYIPSTTAQKRPTIGFIYLSPKHRNKGLASKIARRFNKKHPNMLWFARVANKSSSKTAQKAGLSKLLTKNWGKHDVGVWGSPGTLEGHDDDTEFIQTPNVRLRAEELISTYGELPQDLPEFDEDVIRYIQGCCLQSGPELVKYHSTFAFAQEQYGENDFRQKIIDDMKSKPYKLSPSKVQADVLHDIDAYVINRRSHDPIRSIMEKTPKSVQATSKKNAQESEKEALAYDLQEQYDALVKLSGQEQTSPSEVLQSDGLTEATSNISVSGRSSGVDYGELQEFREELVKAAGQETEFTESFKEDSFSTYQVKEGALDEIKTVFEKVEGYDNVKLALLDGLEHAASVEGVFIVERL